jgi:hypothetical protein
LADRARRRRGVSGVSSAERLAAPSLVHRQWQPVDDDQDRRDGSRPRS